MWHSTTVHKAFFPSSIILLQLANRSSGKRIRFNRLTNNDAAQLSTDNVKQQTSNIYQLNPMKINHIHLKANRQCTLTKRPNI